MNMITSMKTPGEAHINFRIDTYAEKELGLSQTGNAALLALLSLEELTQSLADLGQEQFAGQYLLDAEQKKLASYSYEKRRMEWLGGRIAAKYAVRGMYPRMGWLDLEIDSDNHGRPLVIFHDKKNRTPPDISISHSHGIAAAMAVEKKLCGMDIQKVVPSVTKIRDRFTTSAELELVRKATPESLTQEVLLTMLWAAKESLRKAADTSPLPGFLELCLTDAAPVPDTLLYTSGTRLHFAGLTTQVISGLHHDFAVAFTASP